MRECAMVLFLFLVTISALSSALPSEDTSEQNVSESQRHSSSSLMSRIVNMSSAAILEEEAIANASSALSNTSLDDIERDNITQTLQLRYRERKKQERIIVIQAQILHRLRINRQPNISSSMFSEDEQRKIELLVEKMDLINNNAQKNGLPPGLAAHQLHTIQRLQSFYPSCSWPNNTDKASWDYPGTFRVFYDVPFNKYTLNSEIHIMLAKLRLYKITGNVDPNYVGWEANQSMLPRYNLLETLINNRAANGINVSIYQYTKPPRMNRREKKRLVDSRTLAYDYQGWVEFNVISSLNHWLHHSKKNFGFDVQVEDAYGNKLNPNLYFHNMNCSSEVAKDPPFPNIMELHPEMGENESSLFDNETYPTLDLQTSEIPRDFSDFEALMERLNERVIRKRSNRQNFKPSCKKEEIYISFSEMGLDDIILWPQGINWTFCDGFCPLTNEISGSKEGRSLSASWFQRFFQFKKPKKTECTVTRRESLPIIYYDGENQVMETILEDSIPIECGCTTT